MKLKYPDNSLPTGHAVIYYGSIAEFNNNDLLSMLSLNEIKRAGKFTHDSDRRLYSVTRAMLKKILAAYLQKGIEKIDLDYDTHGKPFLPMYPGLQFNCSHTAGVFAIGLVQKHKIGIDIENKDRVVDLSKIKNFLFSGEELKQFENTHSAYKQEAFINCWTKKEALLKAAGSGLTRPMNEFSVSGLKNEKIKFNTTHPHLKNNGWFVKSFHLPGNTVGALATNGKIVSVKYINMNEY